MSVIVNTLFINPISCLGVSQSYQPSVRITGPSPSLTRLVGQGLAGSDLDLSSTGTVDR